jgi:hypothetical protein
VPSTIQIKLVPLLKTRCANSDFLQVTCPKRASYAWRGIIHGKDLLSTGLIWRIGDGSKISVWKTNWTPRTGVQRPLGHQEEECPGTVNEFLMASGGAWDKDKLRQ